MRKLENEIAHYEELLDDYKKFKKAEMAKTNRNHEKVAKLNGQIAKCKATLEALYEV